MKPAKILIVEDKSVIAEGLASILENAGYSILGKAQSGEEALMLVQYEVPDVLLMDIHLAGQIDGIETVETLMNRSHSIPVIYLTDFHDEATIQRAKHTRPAAYLLKPYQKKDLLIAIDIAFFNASSGKEAVPNTKPSPSEMVYPFNDRIFIKDKDVFYRLDVADILWIEANGSYCHIKTVTKVRTVSVSMGLFNEKFSHPMLLRVHRSFIVNVDKITAIKGNMLVINDSNENEIPMSDSFREEVEKRLHRI